MALGEMAQLKRGAAPIATAAAWDGCVADARLPLFQL
jgi:hypothetical protein